MSSNTTPITLTRFSSALSELPIDAIYAKHAELRNSITHMQASNQQLEDYARDNDDRECYEALLENRQVIKRFEERIQALRREVQEVRGMLWRPVGEDGAEGKRDEEGVNGDAVAATGMDGVVNGDGRQEQRNGVVGGVNTNAHGAGAQDGSEEDGVFL